MSAQIASLWRGHRFALLATCYALGVIVIARTSPLVVAAALAICTAIACITRNTLAKFLIPAGLALASGAAAAALALWHDSQRPYAALDGRHILVQGVALERPRLTDSASLRVRIRSVIEPAGPAGRSLAGAVALVNFPAAQIGSLAGQTVMVRGRLDLPGVAPRNEGEPAERDILNDQGIAVSIAVHRASDVRAFGDAAGWEAWWARLRLRAATSIEARLPALEATVLEGILWGDRGNLPQALRQEFSDTGTVHVLTTAGLHLGIMAALVAWLLGLFPIPRGARVMTTLAAAWLYAMLAGMHLPTLRAATMLTAGTAAHEMGRGRTQSAVFAAAASAVMLPHPLIVLSPSFSMSFACVIGIALVSPALSELGLREGGKLPHFLVEVLRTSLAVQIALWPFQALYFNAFTPYAVLANAVVVPLVGLVMAAGAGLCVCSLALPALAVPLGNITWWGLLAIVGAVRFCAALPASHIDVPPPTHGFLVLYWACLGALVLALQRGLPRRKILAACAMAAPSLFLIYCVPGLAQMHDRRIHLDAIDVGQADCLLVRTPGGHAMLVDGGGRLERTANGFVVAAPIGDRIAERTVMPFLLRHWVLRLDAVVLTHPHGDHAGGLPVILEREHVGTLWDSAQLYSGPAYHRALDVVRERDIVWRRALRGDSFDLGPTTHVAILAPELPLITGTSSDINNNSVVLRVSFGHEAILLTGDAQSEAEARLLSHGRGELRADILKVGHHGSAYSSTPEFLAAVQPKLAIISCGLHNVFGHPSPRTLEALRSVHALTYRTDLDGGVSVVSDGTSIQSNGSIATP